ncbi:MAG: SGNH/GDSL hydrolase family protein [Tyzzerella sp.]|nr:SGNH/GDSL hydrolase family protein [Tyzzerella sp.]
MELKVDYTKCNTVESNNQIQKNQCVSKITKNENGLRVIFIGNSITRHAPKPEIGWLGDWGMAASQEKYDYVHRVVAELEKRYGAINYCIVNVAEWESDYPKGLDLLQQHYKEAREFCADIVIIRIGENMKNDMLAEVDCKPFFEDMIRFFTPNQKAKVVVTDSFWQRKELDCTIAEIAQENGYTFCRLHDLQENEKTMALGQFEHKGVAIHPSDYGMECIAKRILDVI